MIPAGRHTMYDTVISSTKKKVASFLGQSLKAFLATVSNEHMEFISLMLVRYL